MLSFVNIALPTVWSCKEAKCFDLWDETKKGLPNKKIINRFGEQGEKKSDSRIGRRN
jgi:hypothetical protein